MAKVHILGAAGRNAFRAVLHGPAPTGSNAAGIPWSDCIIRAGLNASRLSVGDGPGQISQKEADDIASGLVIEVEGIWEDTPRLILALDDGLTEVDAIVGYQEDVEGKRTPIIVPKGTPVQEAKPGREKVVGAAALAENQKVPDMLERAQLQIAERQEALMQELQYFGLTAD